MPSMLTWTRIRSKMANSSLSSTYSRTLIGFWLLGLINNLLYVVTVSAALDLVGPTVPKGVVLVANVVPSFGLKLAGPYFMHAIPYGVRICCFVGGSVLGMLLVALSPDAAVTHNTGAVVLKMLGIALASLLSGGGEFTCLGLTHYYDDVSLAAWSSGTGGAGLIGAGAYVLATTTVGLSVRTSLLAFSFLPLISLVSFFVVLPPRHAMTKATAAGQYEPVPDRVGEDEYAHFAPETAGTSAEHSDEEVRSPAQGGLLAKPPSLNDALSTATTADGVPWAGGFLAKLERARALFFPYMLPLILVYVAEYTINQGVAPTLLFPLDSTPFSEFRDFYPTYNAIYQLGVFISRSSIFVPGMRIHRLYLPSLLQWANLGLLIIQALFDILPSVWLVFAITFWEGLLGGAVYVNTFAEIRDDFVGEEREFSLTATTASDSAGILVAAVFGMALETGLCDWQVHRLHRDWCNKL